MICPLMTHMLIKQYLNYSLIPPTSHPPPHSVSPPTHTQLLHPSSSTIFKLVLIIAKNTMLDNMKPITTAGMVQYPRQLIWKPIHIKVSNFIISLLLRRKIPHPLYLYNIKYPHTHHSFSRSPLLLP